MLNQYPAWKYALIAILLVVGGIYASPNLYPDDFAIQVTGTQSTTELDSGLVSRVESALAEANISAKEIELQDRLVLVRFNSGDDQLAAKSALGRLLGDEYIAALNMAPTTPIGLRVSVPGL